MVGIIIMVEALLLLWPSDHPLALNDVPDIPTESLKMIREGAVDVKEQKLNNDCCAESGRKTIIYSHSAFFCH